MPLTHDLFIKTGLPFHPEYALRDSAPMFRRRFALESVRSARLSLCALGYGYVWINGKKVTEDLLTSPFSNYEKTLWYYSYDVTSLLKEGENVIAVMLGNGFFNESFKTSWDFDQASWRDQPKMALCLEADGQTVLVSDEQFLCTKASPVIYNHLRSGEYFDARLYDERWTDLDYDDSSWMHAVRDATPPKGILRLCPCEAVRIGRIYPSLSVRKTDEKKYVFDLGQNISGYVRLKICQPMGDEITIRYAEQLHEDGSLNLNDGDHHYKDSPYETDKFICDGREHIWSPMFTYHGFRYIEADGLNDPTLDTISGVFIHQDVKPASSFECSDETLNRLFRIGQMATLSNLFYMPTDCPTREKLGWANDAQASCEQMLTNFTTYNMYKKWIVDIRDAMREDGAMPGIIPTAGWGYEWGNGPVSDGILFEVPYRVYLHTGDSSLLTDSLPCFYRYLDYLKTREDPADGEINFGLTDWTCPEPEKDDPLKLINSALRIKFLRITALAERLAGHSDQEAIVNAEIEDRIAAYKALHLAADGTCVPDNMCSAAMTIYNGLYDDLEPLKQQLMRHIEARDFHHNCGMVGLRRLYVALNRCGLQEYAYRIITAKGRPCYSEWLEGDATTLWEVWDESSSKNHHMYSDFMSWLMKTPGGIDHADNAPGFSRVRISPYFLKNLDYCRATQNTVNGEVSVHWERTGQGVCLIFRVPEGMIAEYEGKDYAAGEYQFAIS